jgi:predicted phosphodiesterase
MKFAIIADVHANLEAIQAVLTDAKEQKCTHFAFLGDFVGICADPKACIDIVRGMNAPCVKGNHDEYCGTNLPVTGLNTKFAKDVEWTRRQLAKDDRRWLRKLLYARRVEDFTIVHASPMARAIHKQPEQLPYVLDNLAVAASFPNQRTQICFIAHTHVPVAFCSDTVTRGGTYTKFKLEPGKNYSVNPGSVGQPLDNNPKAAYVVYDMDESTVELRRRAYDYAATRKKIRDAGLGDI